MPNELLTVLEDIFEDASHQRRGRRFEELLELLLFKNRFQVRRNPGAARPRQTDLYGCGWGMEFVVEAKWQSKPMDVSHVDDCRSRLKRLPNDIFACMFSMSGYAPTAIAAAEAQRRREVLLFDSAELYELSGGYLDLAWLIQKKREVLRVDGKVWFLLSKGIRSISKVRLPKSAETILQDGQPVPTISCIQQSLTQVLFTRESPCPIQSKKEYCLELRLRIRDTADLRKLLALLNNALGLSNSGSFAFTQTANSWHGVGLETFLVEIDQYERRYRDARITERHQSEQVAYFDTFQGGYLVLTAQQMVWSKPHLTMGDLEIRLPGIPVDPSPFALICRETDNHGATFREAYDSYEWVHLKEPFPVKALAGIHDSGMASGIVVENPYFGLRPKFPESRLEHSPCEGVGASKILMCWLAQTYGTGDEVNQHFITSIEAAHVGTVTLIRPLCTWDTITKEVCRKGKHVTVDDVMAGYKRTEQIKEAILKGARRVPDPVD